MPSEPTDDLANRLAELQTAHAEAASATVQSVNQRVLSIAERDIHEALMTRPPELYRYAVGGLSLDEDERTISGLIEQSSARASAYAQSAAGITSECFERCMVRARSKFRSAARAASLRGWEAIFATSR